MDRSLLRALIRHASQLLRQKRANTHPPKRFDGRHPSADASVGVMSHRDVERARALIRETLGPYDLQAFEDHAVRNQQNAVAARTADGHIAGIAYGSREGRETMRLWGIAVHPRVRRRGIGSRLLAAFESAARRAGRSTVRLRSHAGETEHFYLKNGYLPVELEVVIPNELFRDTGEMTLLRVRREHEHLVLSFPARDGHSEQSRDTLRHRFPTAKKVAYVFEKRLGG